jgi:HupE / UreJ protein
MLSVQRRTVQSSKMQPYEAEDFADRGSDVLEAFDRLRWLLIGGIVSVALTALLIDGIAYAHGIGGRDAAFVAATRGPDLVPFIYLCAKHMVTGYDHLLFIFGVIFFLYRLRDVFLYVTLFSIGHSITLLAGVLLKIDVNPYLVDAVIGVSVAYKAFDNLGGFRSVFGVQPDNKIAVAGFGLIHGFGLATKLQSLRLGGNGLVANMIGFNIGVEIGQIIALAVFLVIMLLWRRSASFERQAVAANGLILAAGFMLIEYQLAGYFDVGST